MSLAKARARLLAPVTLAVESSDLLALKISADSGYSVRPIPELHSGHAGYAHRRVWPISLLVALGEVTAAPLTPEGELLVWAGAWAILRYLWAFDQPGAAGEMRLHDVTENLHHHRRQLFSEDMSIAVAASALTARLSHRGVPPLILLDADWELERLAGLGLLTWSGPSRPDYIGWYGSAAGPVFVVVECKGCSSSRRESVRQLTDGVAQAISVRSTRMPTRHFVLGAVVPRGGGRMLAHAVELALPQRPTQGGAHWLREARGPLDRTHEARLLRLVGGHGEASALLGQEQPVLSRAQRLVLDGESYVGVTLPAPASGGEMTLTVALRGAGFAAAAAGSPRAIFRPPPAMRSEAVEEPMQESAGEPLSDEYLTRAWEIATYGRKHRRRGNVNARERRDQLVWSVGGADGAVAVETVDGLRVQLAPAENLSVGTADG
jgi:hypothetical protein